MVSGGAGRAAAGQSAAAAAGQRGRRLLRNEAEAPPVAAEARAGRRRGCVRPGGARRGGSREGPGPALSVRSRGCSEGRLRGGRDSVRLAAEGPRPGRPGLAAAVRLGGVRGGGRCGAAGWGWSGLGEPGSALGRHRREVAYKRACVRRSRVRGAGQRGDRCRARLEIRSPAKGTEKEHR